MNNYQIIGQSGQILTPSFTLHPGEVIEMELESRESISKKDFAVLLGLHASQLSELLKGKRHVSATIALRLEKTWDISADFWMRLQAQYDLSIARQKMAAVA